MEELAALAAVQADVPPSSSTLGGSEQPAMENTYMSHGGWAKEEERGKLDISRGHNLPEGKT
jgi:hypothetical protein